MRDRPAGQSASIAGAPSIAADCPVGAPQASLCTCFCLGFFEGMLGGQLVAKTARYRRSSSAFA